MNVKRSDLGRKKYRHILLAERQIAVSAGMPREILLRSSFREIGRLSTVPRESKEYGTLVVRRERRVFAQEVRQIKMHVVCF